MKDEKQLDTLTRKLSDMALSLFSVYADQSLSISETDREIEGIITNNQSIEDIRDNVLSLNGIQKPPAGVCPLKDLNDEIVDATEARGSNAADGVKKYMHLFRSAALVAKNKSSQRSDRIVRTEDFKEAALNLDI